MGSYGSITRPKYVRSSSMSGIYDDVSTTEVSDIETPQEEKIELVVAETETCYVRYLRVLVVLILMLATAICAASVFLYTSNTEYQDFELAFYQYARLIVDTVHANTQHKLEATGAIAALVQGHAITSNSSWPFVTVPFFEEHIMSTRSLTDAYGVLLIPIVSDENRLEWERYSVQHRGWISESYKSQRDVYGECQGTQPKAGQSWFDVLWGAEYLYPNNPDFSSGIGVPIFRTTDPDDVYFAAPIIDTKPGPYFPQWQAASMCDYYQMTINSNYGQFPDFVQSKNLVIKSGKAVLGKPWQDISVPGYITTMLFPVFDSFITQYRKIVAFLAVDMSWRDLIKGILPPKAASVYVVFKSSLGDVFTFDLSGQNAIFLGNGDLHEQDFDEMAVSTEFGQYLQEPIKDSTYTGLPLYNKYYQYTMTVYPSMELKSQYTTNKPEIYTAAVLCVFLFTSMVFAVYDCMVERRQELVLSSAKRSDEIVSSLFPSTVKDRLFEEKKCSVEMQPCKGEATKSVEKKSTKTTKLSSSNSVDAPQISEMYPCSTVLFADIAGFTAWSSKHPPADVFTLLEALYGAFDKRAKRRGVFKIETIGDCYVAVTGIPTPRDDHALAMAKFARDMLEMWSEEKLRLIPKLGNDLLDLKIRVGIHSGPVTAGVLRGDRARFQLFGDTVNTASRMESNGKPMQIHLSEDTAKLLMLAGKEHWLKPREDKIMAKGKGKMDTYWLEIGSASSRTVSRNNSMHSGISRDSMDSCRRDSMSADSNNYGQPDPMWESNHSHRRDSMDTGGSSNSSRHRASMSPKYHGRRDSVLDSLHIGRRDSMDNYASGLTSGRRDSMADSLQIGRRDSMADSVHIGRRESTADAFRIGRRESMADSFATSVHIGRKDSMHSSATRSCDGLDYGTMHTVDIMHGRKFYSAKKVHPNQKVGKMHPAEEEAIRMALELERERQLRKEAEEEARRRRQEAEVAELKRQEEEEAARILLEKERRRWKSESAELKQQKGGAAKRQPQSPDTVKSEEQKRNEQEEAVIRRFLEAEAADRFRDDETDDADSDHDDSDNDDDKHSEEEKVENHDERQRKAAELERDLHEQLLKLQQQLEAEKRRRQQVSGQKKSDKKTSSKRHYETAEARERERRRWMEEEEEAERRRWEREAEQRKQKGETDGRCRWASEHSPRGRWEATSTDNFDEDPDEEEWGEE